MARTPHLYCPNCLTTFRDDNPPRCPNLACGSERSDEGWGVVLQPGDLIDRHYEIEKVLAVGGAGLTYMAREVDERQRPIGPMLAVKVLYTARASGAYLRRLATEAQILQELDHDNIVVCRGFVHRAGHEPYLVTRFEEGGSLSHHLKRHGKLEARVAAAILRQILLGLDTAHQRGIVHRDLKPDNVLLGEKVDADVVPHVRVADFGIAKVAGGLGSRITKLGTFVGTPEYAAPEQFEQQGATAATDIFACGGLLFYMLSGEPPVKLTRRADIEASYEELLDQLPPALTKKDAPQLGTGELLAINEILFNTMSARAEHRWTAHQVIARLRPLLGIDVPETGTLDVTSEPAPQRVKTGEVPLPLDAQQVPLSPADKDEATTQPFLVGQADPDKETEEGAPEREDLPEVVEPPPPPKPKVEGAPPPKPEPPPPKRRRGGFLKWVVLAFLALLLVGGGGFAVVSLGGVAVIGGLIWGTADGPGGSDDPDAFDPDDPVNLSGSDRRYIQDRLQKRAGRASSCGWAGGVVLTVVVDPEGRVRQIDLDPGYIRDNRIERCVAQALQGAELGELDPPGRARVALILDD